MTSTTSIVEKQEPSPVEILEAANIHVIPFAVSVPPANLHTFTDQPPKTNPILMLGEKSIVGSIVLLNKTVMVWVGWGNTDLSGSTSIPYAQPQSNFGTGAPVMGQVVVSMPRTNYKGAFGKGSNEPSCSQIIGSSNSDDQMLGSQMAARLSTRSGLAVFVSCQLSSSSAGGELDGSTWGAEMDGELAAHRAAALAEKEIWKILQQQQQQQQQDAPKQEIHEES